MDDKAKTYEGYCVKCKEKREFTGKVNVSKSGMNMAKGKCPVCSTTVCRILGKATPAEQAAAAKAGQ